jgi:type I restriction enzyme S subunit
MEVRKGYKQTEIGVIPKDWDVKKLGELASLRTGPFGSSLHKSDYVRDGIPFINPTHIFGGELFPDRDVTVSVVSAKRLSEFQLKTNDIIMGRRGEMGRCAVIKEAQQGWLCGSGSLIIQPNSNIVSEFLQRIISSAYVIGKIEEASVGSTMINLNQAVLFGLRIPCPSLPEQRAIAAALSDVDSLLTALDSLIAKKRLIKQGAMQELLTGKRRLSGFSGKWVVKKIGEITRTTAGGTPSTLVDSYWGGEIKWMSSGELHLKHVYDVEGRITDEGLKNSSTSVIPPKCILIGLAGQGKTRGTVAMNMVELCTNQSIAAIFPSSVFVPEYLYFNFDSRYDELRTISTGDGGRGGLNLTLINKMEVPLPSLAEQTAIAEILSDMDAEITALESRREKTRLLKQGMMQELLTGRIRLV